MRSARLITLFTILVLAAISIAVRVDAAPAYAGSVGLQSYAGGTAYRYKYVTKTSEDTWTASVRSSHTFAIDTIGWSWWTVRETCNAEIEYQQEYDGSVIYNASNYQDWSYHLIHPCGGTRKGWSMGQHDFHESGYTHIRPYWDFWHFMSP